MAQAGASSAPETQLVAQRLQKLESIREMGVEPYPYRFEVTHRSGEVRETFQTLEQDGRKVTVAGRLMARRDHGKSAFADLLDEMGRIQIYVRRDAVGEKAFDLWKLLDIGDFVGVEGSVFRTRTGEMTLKVHALELLCKAIRPLPVPKEEVKDGQRVVHDAFSDPELRYRRRYLDLTLNPDVKDVFRKRTATFSAIRNFFDARGYLEADTPVLQPLYGGASARPFTTHHNALDMKLYLRISNELYLKRLIVGGFEKVYEFSRDFRNEGIDRTHNPEFTMLEAYQAYADYTDMMELTESLFASVAKSVTGASKVAYQGREIDLGPPWRRMTLLDAIKAYGNFDVADASVEELREICRNWNSRWTPVRSVAI